MQLPAQAWQDQSLLSQTDLEHRTNELHQVAQSVSELATLFRDLGALVIDQGSVLDRVDFNIDTARQEIEGAVSELGQATR